MDAFQLLTFLADAAHELNRGQVSIERTDWLAYVVAIDGITSSSNVDPRVALRDVVIELDEQSRGDARPALDAFRLVALAQKKRREADTLRCLRCEQSINAAVDLVAQAEQLEAEALGGSRAKGGAT